MEVAIWSRAVLIVCTVILGWLLLTINVKVGEIYQKVISFWLMCGCVGLGCWTLVTLAAKVLGHA